MFTHEIDLLVTPDPLFKPGLHFEPVFDYEQVLVISRENSLASMSYLKPENLSKETLITYPVNTDRLDIFNKFLTPAGISPKRHKTIEATDIILQMVASGRGVAALPRWLVEKYAKDHNVVTVQLGEHGIKKQIFLGTRKSDNGVDFIKDFFHLARTLALAN